MNYYFDEIKSLKIFKSVSLQTTFCVHTVKRLKSIAKEKQKKKSLFVYLEKLYLWKLMSPKWLVMEIRKFLELNNEITTYQHMWVTSKTLLREDT